MFEKTLFAVLTLAMVVSIPMTAMADRPMGMPEKDRGGPEGEIPLYALARVNGLSTLADAVEIAGLVRTLNTGGPFTVFAPTNEAFAALPEDVLESLLNDPEALRNVLLYHVAAGEFLAEDVVTLTELEMANGQTVTIDAGDGVKVNDANVIATDVLGKNGVVHVIDAVLVPPMDLERAPASSESASFGEVKAGYVD